MTLRKPVAEDGEAIWSLVQACKPLDENSMYCNLVQCDHFAGTCVVAEVEDQGVMGWVSGHVLPDDPSTLFVWQVAVSSEARGLGLGGKMLSHLVNRPGLSNVRRIKTTITKDNDASWALFRRFASRTGGELSHEPHYTKGDHFGGRHDTEHMVTIEMRGGLKKAA
ncbi:diaminobutyrate acetyltransferase [Pseudooceanicola algae]|nr:diaminobutyrate acetyltransferase [Pseudooceanicola algae]